MKDPTYLCMPTNDRGVILAAAFSRTIAELVTAAGERDALGDAQALRLLVGHAMALNAHYGVYANVKLRALLDDESFQPDEVSLRLKIEMALSRNVEQISYARFGILLAWFSVTALITNEITASEAAGRETVSHRDVVCALSGLRGVAERLLDEYARRYIEAKGEDITGRTVCVMPFDLSSPMLVVAPSAPWRIAGDADIERQAPPLNMFDDSVLSEAMAGCVDTAVAGGLLEAAKRRAQDMIAARRHPGRFAAGLVSARRRGILEQ